MALQNVRAFEKENADYIVTLCASRASHRKHNYPGLPGDDPKILEKAHSFAAKVIDFSSFTIDVLGLKKRGSLIIVQHTAEALANRRRKTK